MFQPAADVGNKNIHIDANEASSHALGLDPSITVPDRDLLFKGDFKKSGSDLVLTRHDTTAVILNYFSKDRRPSLTTPDGASLKGETVDALAGADQPERYAQAADISPARTPIGRVEKVSGSVTVLRNGAAVELRLGDAVAKGDVIQTEAGAGLTIRFNDGTVFLLSANARIVLNDMVYAAGSTSNSTLITLVQGIIGFVAGQIAKTGDMKVDTPVATMAIRGTAVQAEISAQSGVTKISVLTEPDGSVGTVVLLDKNNSSRVLTSVSDPRVATLLTPVAASEPLVTQITKTADDLRSDNDFVRNLFQVFGPQPQRRGSSEEPDHVLIVPASLQAPIEQTDIAPVNIRFLPSGRLNPIQQVPLVIPTLPDQVRGRAVEDGPVTRLAAVTGKGVALPLVDLPETLPPGVRYNASSHTFLLDPSDPAYQGLGQGETTTVKVAYTLVDNGSRIPALVSWTILGRNDPPVANPDMIGGVSETGETILNVRANDNDLDKDLLRIVDWTSPLEGSLRLDASGNLIFDPGRDFQALSAGETATISFNYTVSDSKGGLSSTDVKISVAGTGTFLSSQKVSITSDTLDFNDQAVSVAMTAPSETVTATADLRIAIGLGPVLQPQMNILYLVDVSGSTSGRFQGDPVGDANNDGRSDTVLDAEIASLVLLTERIRALGFSPADVSVTVIPFNGSAGPTAGSGADPPVFNAMTFSLETIGVESIEAYLKDLNASGETDYASALQAANDKLQELDQGGEKNVLFFLSDGAGQGDVDEELVRLNGEFGAAIVAVGTGRQVDLSSLNVIDNTDGASRLTAPDQIDPSVVGLPVRSGEIADLDIFVNGNEVAGVGRESLISTPEGWVIDTKIDGLNRMVGSQNSVSAIVTFTNNEVFRTELNIAGALPRSTDFMV